MDNKELFELLTQGEKSEIAKRVFEEEFRKSIKGLAPKQMLEDYERILSNSIFFYIDKVLEQDSDLLFNLEKVRKLLAEKLKKDEFLTEKAINSLFFRNYWEREEPDGQILCREVLRENRNHIKQMLIKALMQLKVKNFVKVMEDFVKVKDF